MRIAELAFAPVIDHVAVGVEHDHRRGAAVEHVNAVLRIYGDRCRLFVNPALGQLAPVLARDPVLEISTPKYDRAALSVFSPVLIMGQSRFEFLYIAWHRSYLN